MLCKALSTIAFLHLKDPFITFHTTEPRNEIESTTNGDGNTKENKSYLLFPLLERRFCENTKMLFIYFPLYDVSSVTWTLLKKIKTKVQNLCQIAFWGPCRDSDRTTLENFVSRMRKSCKWLAPKASTEPVDGILSSLKIESMLSSANLEKWLELLFSEKITQSVYVING